MERHRFDALVRSLARSRRAYLGGALGLGALTVPGLADARKKKRKKKKQKVRLNEFGCVNVGSFCTTADQCCSGICEGTNGKKQCQAHDAGTCQGQDACTGEPVLCITTHGEVGRCVATTGNAGYCMGSSAYCFDCATDADCVPACGAGAACIVCAGCGGTELQTACASTSTSFYACVFS